MLMNFDFYLQIQSSFLLQPSSIPYTAHQTMLKLILRPTGINYIVMGLSPSAHQAIRLSGEE